MNKSTLCLSIFLVLGFAATCPAFQADPHSGAKNVRADPSWGEHTASMEKMCSNMTSVESSGSVDVDFVRLMLPHHQAAVDMARTQLLHGNDPQMRRLAQEIITDQQSEIELMQLWLKQREADSLKTDQIPHSQMRRGH